MIFTSYSELLQAIPLTDLDDDVSESSTVDVQVIFSAKDKDSSLRKRLKKNVSFDESKNSSFEAVHQKDVYRELWYTPYEVQGFRAMNGFALKKMQRDSSVMLGSLFTAKQVLENTYGACLGMLYDDIDVLCPVEASQFHFVLQNDIFPEGLVTYASNQIRRDIRMRRQKVVALVKLIQRTVRNQKSDDTAEYIRTSLENISRPSRIFARLVAETQAACI